MRIPAAMAMLRPILSLPSLQTPKFRKHITSSSSSRFPNSQDRHICFSKHICNSYSPSKSVCSSSSSSPNDLSLLPAKKMVEEFNAEIPIEAALAPPSSWYTDPTFLSLEFDRVFYRGWQAVGFTEQIKDPHDFFTGRLGRVEFVICRGANRKLHAFHNVCRHRASLLASGSGNRSCFVCPYHGWTYGLDGALLKATRISGIEKFNINVFCDNFIDGGYHVPYAHKGFASGFNHDTYSTTIYDKVSIQECESAPKEQEDALSRIGSKAFYAFIFPNFIINRYGPWMETNLILPLGPNKCQVISDYFLEPDLKDDKSFIDRSIDESEGVLMEDITLCEHVQRGLESPAYTSGRYVPTLERAVHHFHCLLYHNLLIVNDK